MYRIFVQADLAKRARQAPRQPKTPVADTWSAMYVKNIDGLAETRPDSDVFRPLGGISREDRHVVATEANFF
jgi:hypothetical protein